MKNKVTLLNVLSSILLQAITVISGFVVPRIILSTFGSETNGLVASLNQFLGYIVLLEGGVTGVISANLYKPLVNNNSNRVSAILCTAKSFYTKIGFVFILYTLVVAVLYPLLMKMDIMYVSSLVLILSLVQFIQYMFSLTIRTLLNTDKKVYVVSFTQIGITIANMILVVLSVRIYPQIHFVKLLSGLVYLIQPIVFSKYVRKHYKIDWKTEQDNTLIKQRWNGFAINVAAFIHGGTDVTILTLFSNLEIVSVYSVYAIVTTGLKNLVNAVTSSINPTIGQAYAIGDEQTLNNKLDLFELTVFFLTGFLFTTAGLLITPFVQLYTKGVTDAPYYQPLFGAMLVMSEAIYLFKAPHLSLAYSANKFKEISKHAYIEAGINIIISILLVNKLGLIGVAIGTILAMIYRMAFHVYFTSKLIPSRKQIRFYSKLTLTLLVSGVTAFACSYILPINNLSIFSWIIRAIEYSLIVGISYFLAFFFTYKRDVILILNYVLGKRKH